MISCSAHGRLRSLVQQEPILFARSILDNIRYGQEDTRGAWGHGMGHTVSDMKSDAVCFKEPTLVGLFNAPQQWLAFDP